MFYQLLVVAVCLTLGVNVAKGQSNSRASSEERPLPSNLDAERSVLGAILLSGIDLQSESKALSVAEDVLKPEDFFLDQHRRIYKQMVVLGESQQAIDLVTLTEELYRNGDLEASGGAPYLASLADGMPKISNVERYARIVKEKAMLRGLIHAAHAIQQMAFQAEEGATDLINRAAESIIELSIEAESGEGEMTYRDAAIRLTEELESPPATVRAVTGIAGLDKITGGFLGGELIVVTASQTGAGKSLMAEGIRRCTCAAGGHGLYCSGEMKATHLVGRGLAANAGVQQRRIRNPELLTQEDKESLRRAATDECPFCTVLYDELSLSKIRRTAQRLKAKRGKLSVIVVDYDELVTAPGKDELEQQKNLVRGLKRLAVSEDCAVILVSQLRKPLNPGEMKKPTLERIYGTGAKSKHSSMVIFVDRPWVRELKGNETEATIYVMKNRDGGPGKIKAIFNVAKLRFEEGQSEADGSGSNKSWHDKSED